MALIDTYQLNDRYTADEGTAFLTGIQALARIPLDQLRAEGYDVRDEDVARVSPLGFRHINMLGRYAFTIPDMVARGELRPLRNPSTLGIDDA